MSNLVFISTVIGLYLMWAATGSSSTGIIYASSVLVLWIIYKKTNLFLSKKKPPFKKLK